MDYEQKYKEALAWVESIYPELNHEHQMEAEAFFSELAKSEDERIRKVLIDYFNRYKEQEECGINTFYGIPTDNILAWLEKQGQKPANKVEPKFKVKYAGSEYNVLEVKDTAGVTYYGIEDEPNHIDYVQAKNCERVGGYSIKESRSPFPTKPAKFSEQKPTWSEEDEEIVNGIINDIQERLEDYPTEQLAEIYFKEIKWLKFLKQRETWKPSELLGCLEALKEKTEQVINELK